MESFNILLEQIEKKEILLPDFQRNFVWKDAERQTRLIASVLSKMPVGSVLLLKGKARDYAYKLIGCKNRKTFSELSIDGDKEVKSLLDGQQRVTVLTMVFSDLIYKMAGNVGNLISPTLKRRFFLRLPRYSNNNSLQDHFGLRKLCFPMRNTETEEPSFLADDIYETIKVVSFNKDDAYSYNPFKSKEIHKSDLVKYCISEEECLVPLFLLTGDNDAWLKKIVEQIIEYTVMDILEEFDNKNDQEKKQYIFSLLTSETLELIENKESVLMRDKFEEALKSQGGVWASKMISFLNSCINNIQLSQIVVDNNKRDRAINIYENMNKGGVQLGLFELVTARFASISDENYHDFLLSKIRQKKNHYTKAMFSTGLKNNGKVENHINSENYCVYKQFECYDEKNDEISSVYINTYLNVLSLYSNVNNFCVDEIKKENVDLIKKKKILDINAQDLRDKCENVCDAIDKALFFFQMRCGIRRIKEINYSLMLTVVSYIILAFDDDEIVYDYLEAWYWGAIFSGYFNTDQTSRTIDSIVILLEAISNKDSSRIKNICKGIFKANNFSNKDFLLLKNAETIEIDPKDFLIDTVCQFYLAQTYKGLLDDRIEMNPFIEGQLDRHHVIPLNAYLTYNPGSAKSAKELRENKKFFLNSALNFIYLTPEEDKSISDMDLDKYQSKIESLSTRNTLGFTGNMDMTDDDKCKKILDVRFENFSGSVEKRIDILIP